MKPKQCESSVLQAIETGYSLIKTARFYYNEEDVGAAIQKSPVSRDELINATKIWVTNFFPKSMKKSLERSLKKLQLQTVDLLYFHWPYRFFYKPQKTLKALSEFVKKGQGAIYWCF